MTQRLVGGLLVLAGVVCAQHRVDSQNTYNRIICVVPMIGKGTPADPKRAQYAPAPSAVRPSPNGIISFSQQISDDGRFALVEFVARDRSAFSTVLADRTATCFEKGIHQKAAIEAQLKRFKKDFDLDKFGMVLP